VAAFQLSPDGSRAVYRASQERLETDELYLVPSDGSAAPRKLSGPMVAGGNAAFWFCDTAAERHSSFTPDGSRFVYLADQDQDEVHELYSARTDVSTAPVGSTVRWSPAATSPATASAGRHARVLHGEPGAGRRRGALRRARGREREPAQAQRPARVRGNVEPAPYGLRISPDGRRVVYVADQERHGREELFGVPSDGSAPPVKLSGPMTSAGDVPPAEARDQRRRRARGVRGRPGAGRAL